MSKVAIISIGVGIAAIAATGWAVIPRGQGAATQLETEIGIAPENTNAPPNQLLTERAPALAAATTVRSEAPVVLELFTSQGCSSCPPADALVGRLARTRQDILVISRPVTYWDRLGWRDTLAKPENTDLQRAYAARGLAGYNGVYTPQAVINGRSGTVGSNAQEVEALFQQAAPEMRQAPRIVLGADNKVTIRGSDGGQGQLSLLALDSRETVSIALGENRNRTITYTNLLVDEDQLGTWRGGEATFSLPQDYRATRGADRFALILRQGSAGPILAARRL